MLRSFRAEASGVQRHTARRMELLRWNCDAGGGARATSTVL